MLRLFIGFILGENRQPSNLFESYEDILQRKRAQERRYRCELLLTLHCDSLHNSVLGLITKTKFFLLVMGIKTIFTFLFGVTEVLMTMILDQKGKFRNFKFPSVHAAAIPTLINS